MIRHQVHGWNHQTACCDGEECWVLDTSSQLDSVEQATLVDGQVSSNARRCSKKGKRNKQLAKGGRVLWRSDTKSARGCGVTPIDRCEYEKHRR